MPQLLFRWTDSALIVANTGRRFTIGGLAQPTARPLAEPPSAGNPLLVRDDVVLTPHTAAYLRTAFDRTALACAENALAGLDGTLDPSLVVNAEVLREG